MDRVKGLGSFLVVAAVVLAGLRLLHVGIPLVLPETLQGPIAVASLDDVRPRVGFTPMLPAYRPATLGSAPASMTVVLGPRPSFTITWRADGQYLAVTQRRGGPPPDHPPLAQPLTDVPGSTFWTDGGRSFLALQRDDFWIVLETSLSTAELRRFADTLAPY